MQHFNSVSESLIFPANLARYHPYSASNSLPDRLFHLVLLLLQMDQRNNVYLSPSVKHCHHLYLKSCLCFFIIIKWYNYCLIDNSLIQQAFLKSFTLELLLKEEMTCETHDSTVLYSPQTNHIFLLGAFNWRACHSFYITKQPIL